MSSTRRVDSAALLTTLALAALGCNQGGSEGGRTGPITLGGLKTFATTYGGGSDDRLHDVHQTPDGGYVAVGETSSFGRGEKDFWALKLDRDGNVEWSRAHGEGNVQLTGNPEPSFSANGALDTHQIDAIPTADGGVIAVGAADDGRPDSDEPTDRIVPVFRLTAVRLDAAGHVVWRRAYPGGDRGGRFTSIAASGDGFVCAGYVEGRGSNRDDRNRDLLVIQIDAGGTEAWRKVIGTAEHEVAMAVEAAADGGVVACGFKSLQIAEESLETQAWVVKIRDDSQRSIAWERTFSGGAGIAAYSVRRSADGFSYVVAGGRQEDINDSYTGNDNTRNAWAVRLQDADGDDAWENDYSANPQFNAPDYAFAVERTTTGGWVAAGYGGILSRAGYVLRIASDGDEEEIGDRRASFLLGASDRDELHAVRRTADAGYILAGLKSDPAATRAPRHDAWVVKLSESFEVEWERTYNFGGASAVAYSVRETAAFDGYVLAGAGPAGGWIIKVDRGGDEVWRRRVTERNDETARSVALVDDDGDGIRDDGYLLAGTTGSFGGDDNDAFVVRLDTAGNLVWQKTLRGDGFESVQRAAAAAAGKHVIAGITSTGSGSPLLWAFELDRDGSPGWRRVYDIAGLDVREDSRVALAAAPGGGWFLAAGSFAGSAVLRLGGDGLPAASWPQAVRLSRRAVEDIASDASGGCVLVGNVLAGSDTGATLLWACRLDAGGEIRAQVSAGNDTSEGAGPFEEALAIAADPAGGFFVAGRTRTFGSGLTCPAPAGLELSCGNVWMLRLTDGLDVSWQKSYATAGDERVVAVRATSDGGFIAAGDIDADPLVSDASAARAIDGYLIKGEAGGALCDRLERDTSAAQSAMDEGSRDASVSVLAAAGIEEDAPALEPLSAGPAVDTVCFTFLEDDRDVPATPEPPGEVDFTGYWLDEYTCRESCGRDPAENVPGQTYIRLDQSGDEVRVEDTSTNLEGSGRVRGRTLTWSGEVELPDGRTLRESGTFTLSADGMSFSKQSSYTITGGAGPSCQGDCTGSAARAGG